MGERLDAKTPLLNAEIEMSDAMNHTQQNNDAPFRPITITATTSTTVAANTLRANAGDVERGAGVIHGTEDQLEGGTERSDETNEEEYVYQAKLGHKFLFCCCDTKRAVVWLNYVVLLLNLLTFTAAIMQGNRQADGFVKAMVMQACGMFITFTTLLGAYWYSKTIVSVGLIYACYHLTIGVMNMSKYNWTGENEDGKLVVILPFLWYLLTFYAEAMFIFEVHDGTMSPETYKSREQYSCCCNSFL